MRPRLTFIIGCTGCGKGSFGRELARRIGAEIVSVDSMKVYRRMDIGTAKPSAEASAAVNHHMIDVVEPSEPFSVAEYVTRAQAVIADIHTRGRPILVVGGTPLYIKGLTEGLFEGPGADPSVREALHREAEQTGTAALHERLRQVDPVAANRIHPNDLRRIVRALEVFEVHGRPISDLQVQWGGEGSPYDVTIVGLRRDREDQNHRINERVRRMIDQGLVDEVRTLLDEPRPMSHTARKAVGYAEIIQYLAGAVSLADAVEMIKINTRKLAKSQRTWFRRFSLTEWVDLTPDADMTHVAEELLEHRGIEWSA